jgi:hypothetical protein
LECIPFSVLEEVEKAFNIHVILAKAKGVKIDSGSSKWPTPSTSVSHLLFII